MSDLGDAKIPAFKPRKPIVEWDVPPAVGIGIGAGALALMAYVLYKMSNDEEEDDWED